MIVVVLRLLLRRHDLLFLSNMLHCLQSRSHNHLCLRPTHGHADIYGTVLPRIYHEALIRRLRWAHRGLLDKNISKDLLWGYFSSICLSLFGRSIDTREVSLHEALQTLVVLMLSHVWLSHPEKLHFF